MKLAMETSHRAAMPCFNIVGSARSHAARCCCFYPAIAERMTTNAALGARLSFIRNDLADPADLPRFVDAIFAAFSAPSSAWSIMPAYPRSHGATCSTSPPRAMTRTSPCLQEDARGRGRLSRKRAPSRVHILFKCCHRSSRAREVCDVQSGGRHDDEAVCHSPRAQRYRRIRGCPARSDPHADDRRGSVAFRQAA